MLPEEQPNPRAEFRKRVYVSIGLAAVGVFILWNVPQLGFVLYPFRLFVTFVHETGHGLAAILTGGRFVGFVVHPDGSGIATTAGGIRLIILPAGYLGAALFGGVLFFVVNRFHYVRTTSIVLGVLLAIVTILYANPFAAFSVAFVIGILIAFLLIALGMRAPAGVNALMLNMLAILTGLNAVLDLWYLVENDQVMIGEIRNDAAAFSQLVSPGVPGSFWATIWAVIAVGILGTSVYQSLVVPLRRKRVNRRHDAITDPPPPEPQTPSYPRPERKQPTYPRPKPRPSYRDAKRDD